MLPTKEVIFTPNVNSHLDSYLNQPFLEALSLVVTPRPYTDIVPTQTLLNYADYALGAGDLRGLEFDIQHRLS